jgi:hypothetical protein
MEKSGLTEETPVIDFSFLQSSVKTVTTRFTRATTAATATTVKGKCIKKTYRHNKKTYKRNKKTYKRKRKHKHK